MCQEVFGGSFHFHVVRFYAVVFLMLFPAEAWCGCRLMPKLVEWWREEEPPAKQQPYGSQEGQVTGRDAPLLEVVPAAGGLY